MSRVINELAKTAYTWNGALSNSTTLSPCLDYFSKVGTYTNRPQTTVDADMNRIFAENPSWALKLVFGTRLITRKPTDLPDIATGFGRRDEFYKAITWLHYNKPNLLYKNLHLISTVGSWKDFLNEPLINLLNRIEVFKLFKDNLCDDLVRKFLPQIRSTPRSARDKARSTWAKEFAKYLGLNHKTYRNLKSTGSAHTWQKLASSNAWDDINFNTIPGKAFLNLTTRTGKDKLTALTRHGQDTRLLDWMVKQNKIKFTGYPYELAHKLLTGKATTELQKMVLNKQFETVLAQMENHSLGNVLACLDTSGSMSSEVTKGVSALDICLSMGVAFSMMNVGYFKDTAVAFSDNSTLIKLNGSFTDRITDIQSRGWFMGSTNFQSVIDLLVSIRKRSPEIPVNEYPETLLIISDMQFNKSGGYSYNSCSQQDVETNYEVARKKLNSVGLKDVRIIWWYVNGAGTDFPSTLNDSGTYLIGGFDPVNIKSLMGIPVSSKAVNKEEKDKRPEGPLDGMMNWMSQPIFDLIQF